MSINDIPTINASLNGLATLLLTIGFIFIKSGNREAHRKCMISAVTVSAVFMVGYVTHKILVHGVHSPFGGEGAIRTVYYTMLVPRTFLLAIKGDTDRHRAWARWTFPIWYYVSLTGVLIYMFVYQWWPVTA